MARTEERAGGLAPVGLLSSLSTGTTADLLALGRPKEFVPNQVLIREGELSTHVVLLLSGCVKVTATTANGGLSLLAIRVAGELVGELAGLDDQPRSATVTAAGRVRTRIMTQTTFQAFLGEHPDAAVAVSRSISAKLRWATSRRIDFGGCEVRVRVARVLIDLAVIHGQKTPDGLEIGVSLTQPELASLVGAAEPTIHKVLKSLRAGHVVKTEYRGLTILALDSLRAIAGLPTGA